MLGGVLSNMVFHVALSTWIVAGLLAGACVLLWGGGVLGVIGFAVLAAGAAASVLTSSRRHFRRTLHADATAPLVGRK